MPLTKFEKHDHLLLKYGIIGISNAILRKYGTKHAPRTIGDSGCLWGRATSSGGHFYEVVGRDMMVVFAESNEPYNIS
jgi:hypothetical protein